MNLLEFINQNAEKLASIPNAADFGKQLVEAAKAAGFDLMANDPKNPDYLPKSRIDEVVAQRNTYKTDLENRDKQLAELAQQLKDNEPLLNQVKDFQSNNEKLQQQLKEQSLNFAIERGLAAAKARNAKVVSGLIDKSKLVLSEDGATVAGLDEQIKAIQETDQYLFEDPNAAPPPAGSGASNPPPAGDPAPKSLSEALAAKYSG